MGRNTKIDSSQLELLKPNDMSGQVAPQSGQALGYSGDDNHFKWMNIIGDNEHLISNQNTCIGLESGRVITTGDNNTFLGYGSGYSNTIGVKNTFVGQDTGNANVDGDRNTFVGQLAGYNNNANNNVFVGHESGFNNNDGIRNSFLGTYAGTQNTNGNSNTLLGFACGYLNNASYNTGLGSYSLYENQSGQRNTIVGYSAVFKVKGDNNTIIGTQAGYNTEEVNRNTFIGDIACVGNATGKRNTALGYGAGAWANNDLNENVYLGYKAGYYNTIGERLFINTSDSQYPLIHGKFDDREIEFGNDNDHFFLNIRESGNTSIIESPQDDADLFLQTNGSGMVRYGEYSSILNPTIVGYIEQKDKNGTIRKVAVIE